MRHCPFGAPRSREPGTRPPTLQNGRDGPRSPRERMPPQDSPAHPPATNSSPQRGKRACLLQKRSAAMGSCILGLPGLDWPERVQLVGFLIARIVVPARAHSLSGVDRTVAWAACAARMQERSHDFSRGRRHRCRPTLSRCRPAVRHRLSDRQRPEAFPARLARLKREGVQRVVLEAIRPRRCPPMTLPRAHYHLARRTRQSPSSLARSSSSPQTPHPTTGAIQTRPQPRWRAAATPGFCARNLVGGSEEAEPLSLSKIRLDQLPASSPSRKNCEIDFDLRSRRRGASPR